jgi:hypothetical protein
VSPSHPTPKAAQLLTLPDTAQQPGSEGHHVIPRTANRDHPAGSGTPAADRQLKKKLSPKPHQAPGSQGTAAQER